MKTLASSIPLLIALAYAPAHAAPTPLLGSDLNHWTIVAGSPKNFQAGYASIGANGTVYGSILAGDVLTLGASSYATGNVVSVNAGNLGGRFNATSRAATVDGYMLSGGVATTGGSARVGGNLISSGATTIGDHAYVGGNMVSGGVLTTGDTSKVVGNVASFGAGSIGANGTVGGTMSTSGLASVSASGTVSGGVWSAGGFSGVNNGHTSNAAPANTSAAAITAAGVRHDVTKESADITAAQNALANMTPTTTELIPVFGSRSFAPGVYTAAILTPTAGSTFIFQGDGLDNESWVFNISDYMAIGGTTMFKLENVGKNASVIWNSATYASIGAGSFTEQAEFIGTVFAQTYISVGANTTVTGVNGSCGGLYSQTSYVSTGDASIIGGEGCQATQSYFDIVDGVAVAHVDATAPAVPEPKTYALMLGGLGLLAFARKRSK